MEPFVNTAVKAARAAGSIIMQASDRMDQVEVAVKDKHDFVTGVDQRAENEIIQIIRKAYPGHQILAEESGSSKGKDSDYLWIIDPLDGTTNFVHGVPHYAVSIAMKYKDQIQHGVIYDPVRNELFTASRGKGAFLDNKRIRVSTQRKLDFSLIGTGFPFRKPELLEQYLKIFSSLFPNIVGMRRAGSAALDLAYVAAGRLDGFWEMVIKPWDIAAGILLVQEAGGIVTDIYGKHDYFETENIIAGTPKIHDALINNINITTA